jgi:peroxiredoxin
LKRIVLAAALLILGLRGLASAADERLAPLVRALDLRAYPSLTRPPSFEGAAADAGAVSLAKLRGRVVIVNFWASWCAECRPEMADFERLHREHATHGLAVLGVNVREPTPTVRRYAREAEVTFPLVLDPRGVINGLYGVVGLPTTFLIARDGRAVAFAVGPRPWGGAPARALIEALLAEPAPLPATP